MTHPNLKTFVIVLFFALAVQSVQGQKSQLTEKELISKAQNFFKDDNWNDALPLYAHLVSVYPDNPDYNYRFGVCSLLGSRTDNNRPIRYLNNAFHAMPDNKELIYFLGLAYYQDQKFSSALYYFETYLKQLDHTNKERSLIEQKISACKRGMDLLHINQLDEVIVKAEYQKDNFHRAYPIDEFDGSLIKKPEDFSSDRELKSGSQSFVYLSEPRGVLYYSGYQDEKTSQRDIFKITLNKKGAWGTPEKLPEVVNSQFDEDYPVMTDDGATLYFSSKGHNSMGGYDVFRSTFDAASGKFGKPENMGIGINSPFDDILFIPDNSGRGAYFASTRENQEEDISVFKVSLNEGLSPEEKLIAQNAGSGLNLPNNEEPVYASHATNESSTNSSTDEHLTGAQNSIDQTNDQDVFSQERDKETNIENTIAGSVNSQPEPFTSNRVNTSTADTEWADNSSAGSEKNSIAQNPVQGYPLQDTDQPDNTNASANNNSTQGNEARLFTQTAAVEDHQQETMTKQNITNIETGSTVQYAGVVKSESEQSSIGDNGTGNPPGEKTMTNGTVIPEKIAAGSDMQYAGAEKPETGKLIAKENNAVTAQEELRTINTTGIHTDESNMQYAAVVSAESGQSTIKENKPETDPERVSTTYSSESQTEITAGSGPETTAVSSEASLAQVQKNQAKNTSKKVDPATNGLTLSWEVIYTEEDQIAGRSPANSNTTMSSVKQVESVSYNYHNNTFPIDDEPLFVNIESDPIKQVQLVKYSSALSTWPEDESSVNIIFEQEPIKQVKEVHYTSIPWPDNDDIPSLEITTGTNLSKQVESVAIASNHGRIKDENLEISMEYEPIKAIQVVKYAEAQNRGMEEDEILEIVPVNGTVFQAQPVEYANSGWGTMEGDDLSVTTPQTQGEQEVTIEPTYPLSFSGEANEISSLTASESGLLSLPEPISVPMPLEDAEEYAELIRLALTDPDQLTYDELLFAASLVDQPDDKLTIYYASFIRSERDWRAYYNASVAAQTTADAEKAEVYRYQASLIYTEELVGQLSPGMMLKLR